MHRYFQINEDGHNIRCKLYCADPRSITRMVVFCHGFGGHKDNGAAEKFAQRLLSKYKNTAMITFDLPCHGDDVKKKLTLADCDTYLQLVTEYAQRQYAPKALYAYATSFGGYLLLQYLQRHGNSFRKIALRCPAVDMYTVLTGSILSQQELEKLDKGKELPVGFDRKIMVSKAFLQELQANKVHEMDFLDFAEDILILHGTDDEIVPYAMACAFAEDNLITFLPVEGADHRFRDPQKMEIAIKGILEFYGF